VVYPINLEKSFYDLSSTSFYGDGRFPTDITNSLLIDGTNAVSIATGYAFREVDLHLFLFYRISTPTAIKTLFRYLSIALRTENKG